MAIPSFEIHYKEKSIQEPEVKMQTGSEEKSKQIDKVEMWFLQILAP